MVDHLFDRGLELARFDHILEQRQPAFVVVTGQSGTGKSSLLKVFQAHAAAAGWKTVPTNNEEELSVDASTTKEHFSDLLHKSLGGVADESSIETTGPKQARVAVADLKSSVETTAAPVRHSIETTIPINGSFHPCVEQLCSWAPVVLLIDSYRPDPKFASWFADPFIRDVKRATVPIVIVVAVRPDRATKVSPLADEIIPLGPLARHVLSQHFQSIGEQISPMMEPAELDRYVDASYDQPEILNSLTRVLWLARVSPARYRVQSSRGDR